MHYKYNCFGTCSRSIEFDINDNIITNVKFDGGCNGNLKGISKLVEGKKVKKYATGGVVDSTGLQWLDGTPSSPELVLNAKDTKNFLALKDILSGAMKNASTMQANNGDINCDIQINVDSIANDYDVDKIAARIEYNIMKSAKYRNVNNVTTMR